MELIFATQNKNKVEEIQNQISDNIRLVSLMDLDHHQELEETHSTLIGNAQEKARYVYKRYGKDCFADDTGLEIEALNGEPGVRSARYAGESKSFEDNMNKVLLNLANIENRRAQFKTVIALIYRGKEYLFEGICKGAITKEKSGSKGFGYDPIFKADGYSETFAEMSMETKNLISHRGIAVKKLIDFLNTLPKS